MTFGDFPKFTTGSRRLWTGKSIDSLDLQRRSVPIDGSAGVERAASTNGNSVSSGGDAIARALAGAAHCGGIWRAARRAAGVDTARSAGAVAGRARLDVRHRASAVGHGAADEARRVSDAVQRRRMGRVAAAGVGRRRRRVVPLLSAAVAHAQAAARRALPAAVEHDDRCASDRRRRRVWRRLGVRRVLSRSGARQSDFASFFRVACVALGNDNWQCCCIIVVKNF
jgi:hypothetical protein